MKKVLLAIYDIKAKIYKGAFVAETVTDGIRGFANIVKGGNSDIADYPSEFSLFQLAEIDLASGKIIPLEAPFLLASGAEFTKSKNEQEVQA